MYLVPVLVIAYRRHHLLSKLIKMIPDDRSIYIVVDGPRFREDEDDVQIVRKLVLEYSRVRDNVFTQIRTVNLGGPLGIPSAIDWVLKSEESICILEEDCIPSGLAFGYVDRMSSKISLDPRIAGMTLNNFVCARKSKPFQAPFLSIYPHCWGWYTSGESWRKLRPSPERIAGLSVRLSRKDLRDLLKSKFHNDFFAKTHWFLIFQKLLNGKIYHWDYAYTLIMWSEFKYFIAPPVNLVSNIGCDATSQNCKVKSKNHMLPVPDLCDQDCVLALSRRYSSNYDYNDFDRENQSLVFTGSWFILVKKYILIVIARLLGFLSK